MLIDVIEKSIAAMDCKREAQTSKQSADQFAHALGQLDRVTKDLLLLLDCIDAMAESGINAPPALSGQTRGELEELVNECGRSASENALRIETVRLLDNQVKVAKLELDGIWKASAAAYADSAKGYLGMLGGLTEDPATAKILKVNIEKAVSSSPTKASIGALVRDVNQAQTITESFSVCPEVEEFLQKVGQRQATVQDLTDEVLDWLKEKNLMHKIGIKFLT